MAPLLHRAAIRNYRMKILWSALLHRATIKRVLKSEVKYLSEGWLNGVQMLATYKHETVHEPGAVGV